MLTEGVVAPPFQFPADDDREISLKDLRGKHVALYFYPKASTPGCTTQDIVAILFQGTRVEAARIRLSLDGGSPLEAFSIERAAFKAS